MKQVNIAAFLLTAILTRPIGADEPKIADDSCGVTLRDLSGAVLLQLEEGATKHRVRLVELNGSDGERPLQPLKVHKGRGSFAPVHVRGIQYNRVYRVEVDALKSGNWITGKPCIIYTPAFPHSRIRKELCDKRAPSMAAQLGVLPVPAASDYEFLIRDGDHAVVDEDNPRHPNPSFYTPAWNKRLRFGKWYDFYVRAKVENEWREHYGPGCRVRMPDFPAAQIENCPRTLGSMNEAIRVAYFSGTTGWDFEVADSANPSAVVSLRRTHRNYRSIHLTWSTFDPLGIQPDHVYTVRVRGLRGGVEGPWGDTCEIRTPR